MSEFLAAFFDEAYLSDLLKIGVSIFCGLVVGTERTYRGKQAGVRTNVLICLGSCLFMIVSVHTAEMARTAGYTTPDPARIAAQVVTGIGFLGAGTILRNRGTITGLTSAASIWVVAGIGLLTGIGLMKLALTSAIIVVICIESFRLVVNQIRVDRYRYMKLEVVLKKEAGVAQVRKTLRRVGATYSQESTEKLLGEIHYHATLYFRGKLEAELAKDLMELRGVRNVILLDQSVE